MPDHRPQPTDRKRRWVAPVVLGGVVVCIVGLAELMDWRRRAPSPPTPPPHVGVTPLAIPELPKPAPPLGRAELIEAAEGAADDYASGAPASEGKDPLVGRTFRLLIPFGCAGPQSDPGTLQAFYDYDAVRKTLKITARPGQWSSLPLFDPIAGGPNVEAVEGFWVSRPWTSSEACPPARTEPRPVTPTPPAAQTIGLAQIFEKGGSRVLRREGRPYEFVRKVKDDDARVLSHPYRLVLEGRVTGYDDGRALHCWSETVDHRPICVYAVQFTRVAFEDAVTSQSVAEWKE